MTLAKNLVAARNAAGMTRKEVAAALHIPYNTLSNYETGLREPGSDFLIKLAYLYNVTLDALLGIEAGRENILSPTEKELIRLWRGADSEAHNACLTVLRAYQKGK